MEVALYLLDMHRNMESDDRKDPVKVVRAITEMVRGQCNISLLHLISSYLNVACDIILQYVQNCTYCISACVKFHDIQLIQCG